MPTVSKPLPPVIAIDDSEDDLFFLHRALKKAHVKFPLITFNNPIDAIKYLIDAANCPVLGRVPCMIFTDINMPVMNGFEFVTWLRSQKDIRRLPVVVLSTSNSARDVARSRHVGADRHIVKFPTSEVIVQLFKEAERDRTHFLSHP
jgi:CheY-like chemotaxis protein